MSRVRFGAVRTAAVLAAVALAGAGCDSINEAKETVDTATNSVEVCADSTKLTNDKLSAVNTAAQDVASNPTDPAKVAAAQAAVKQEFTELSEGLQAQIDKAKDADVKKALEALDAAVTNWAAKPETYLTEATKFNELTGDLARACTGS
jgi:hypothetical protein